jgi:hypothetical protein
VKEYPDFSSIRHGGVSMWLKRELVSPSTIELMANADALFERSDCVIIKDQKKIKIGRVSVEWQGEKRVVYIKRYNAFSLRYQLQSVLVCSGAENSLRGAAILSTIGVPTARPVAAIEHRRGGMLIKSFFVSEEVDGGKTADAYWREDAKMFAGAAGFRRRRVFLKQLAELFSRLHAYGVYHNDLKDANIMVVPEWTDRHPSFYLLDLEGVRRYAVLSRSRHIKNLVQLNRTFGKYLRRTELLYFLTCYLAGNIADPRLKKGWVEDIFRRSMRLDRVKRIVHGR